MNRAIIAILVAVSTVIAGSAPVTANDGFIALNGVQIKRMFSDIADVVVPDDGAGYGGEGWQTEFFPNGTWEGAFNSGVTQDAFGSWHVKDDQLCFSIKGGTTTWSSPYEGCFGVKADISNGTIVATIPSLSSKDIVLKSDAYGDVAFLRKPSGRKEVVAKPTVPLATRPPATTAQDERRARALEEQRLALERQRLALEQQKLEMQRQALLLKQQQQQAAAVDSTKPVIQTTDTAATTGKTIRVAGIVRDDGRLARVEVAGRRVDVEGDTGRFAAEVPVTLGRNRIVVSATDASGNKAERVVLVTRKRDIPEIAFGSYHAVVIGINEYESLPKLKTAISDARAVAETLEADYGYAVHLMENPTRADIIDKFDELRETLVEEDNLLIYYAGHGWLDEQSGRGYWLPVNARNDRRSRWVSNATLTDALQALHAKHVMVVADSCYSGTLTRSIKVPERNKAYIERIAEKRARVVLSSGGLEPVADSGGGKHSVFAAQFLKALRSNEGVLDGTQMFERVRQTVVLNAEQTPEYSDIRLAGHEGGDFLFVRKD